MSAVPDSGTPAPLETSTSNAGSPSTGEPVFLVVGKLRHAHGIKGEVLMDVITDFPERLRTGVTVYAGDQHRPLRIRSRRRHDPGLLLSFDGYDSPEAAAELRNQLVFVSAHDRPPLPEGEYYHHQIIGLTVVSDDGRTLGRVQEIINTSANDVYVIRPESGPEILIPAIESVILNVDLAGGILQVHLLPGLLED